MTDIQELEFNRLYAKIEHFNRATQLKQIYEWVKTGHINLAQFTGLISKVETK